MFPSPRSWCGIPSGEINPAARNPQFSHGARRRINLIIKTITAITRSKLLKATWQINPIAQSTSKTTKIAQNINRLSWRSLYRRTSRVRALSRVV